MYIDKGHRVVYMYIDKDHRVVYIHIYTYIQVAAIDAPIYNMYWTPPPPPPPSTHTHPHPHTHTHTQVVAIDVMRIAQGRSEMHSVCGVGWGLGGKLAEESEALRDIFGPARYLVRQYV